jgi:hypothetical protein
MKPLIKIIPTPYYLSFAVVIQQGKTTMIPGTSISAAIQNATRFLKETRHENA